MQSRVRSHKRALRARSIPARGSEKLGDTKRPGRREPGSRHHGGNSGRMSPAWGHVAPHGHDGGGYVVCLQQVSGWGGGDCSTVSWGAGGALEVDWGDGS